MTKSLYFVKFRGFQTFFLATQMLASKSYANPKQKKDLSLPKLMRGMSLLSLSKFGVILDTAHHKSALSWFFIRLNVDLTLITATCFMNYEEGFNEILYSNTFY